MANYYCNECGCFFSEEDATYVNEPHTELDGYWYETFMRCPNCGHDNYEDAYECELCGELTIEELCDDCKHEILNSFNSWIDREAKKYELCDNNKAIEFIKDIISQYEF